MRSEFERAIKEHQTAFDLNLPEVTVNRLGDYYDLVQVHNPLLHLVAPCSAKEFAVRHILESLTLLEYLPDDAKFADVGSGAGLPSIPCLIVRKDLRATLIESKEKKASFLNEALSRLDLEDRATVVARQFTETGPGHAELVTCRALDKFNERLAKLISWSGKRKLLFFGGPNLQQGLIENKLKFDTILMPMSEQRCLFVGNK